MEFLGGKEWYSIYLGGYITPLSSRRGQCNDFQIKRKKDIDSWDASLFEGIYDYYDLRGVASVSISLMHYPMLEWNRSRHGSLHLHGHQHNSSSYNEEMREQGIRRYDVGVDANQYCPVSLNSILEFFQIDK